jgi:hypothetical protein
MAAPLWVMVRVRKSGAKWGKRNFVIAPTICMKTKAKFRRRSIAPTILMKIHELIDFQAGGHDITETKAGYRVFEDLTTKI